MRALLLLTVVASTVVLGIVACGLETDGTTGSGSSGSSGTSSGSTGTTIPEADAGADVDPGAPVCTNTTTDPLNCGKCGHSCLGGNCVEGACQPFILLGTLKSPIGLAVDAKRIYWTSQGGIFSMPIEGGVQTSEVVDAGASTTYLTVDNNEVFWTRNIATVGSVNSRALPNGAVQNVLLNEDHPSGITKVGSTIYFTRQWIDSLAQIFPDGGAGIITGNLDFPETLATDGTMIYIAAPGGQIFSVGLAGGNATKLAGNLAGDAPCGIAVSGDTLFVSLRDTNRIVSLPKTGGALKELAYNQQKPHGIAVDDKAIYWANNTSGTIMRLAR